MRLEKGQKEKLLEWVAEGLETDEINARAQDCGPPFTVSRQQVDFYRKTRKVAVKEIAKSGELDALTSGLALKEVRVARLAKLAARMEEDLFGSGLWLDQLKSIGSGLDQQVVEYEEFNAGEVKEYRGVLDDIARELGHRKNGLEVSGPNGGPLTIKVEYEDVDNNA